MTDQTLTSAQRAERQIERKKLSNAHRACRNYLAQSDFVRAEEYAKSRGFTVEEARLTSWDQGQSLPRPPVVDTNQILIGPELVVPPVAPVAMVNGWPSISEAEVWGFCRNKRLVLIHLPDGREASMWVMGRHWRIGNQLQVALESAMGDPRYTPIDGSIK